MNKRNPFNWLRWIARITGTAIILLTLYFLISEGLPPVAFAFAMWGVATAGLVLAFWKEGMGGIISLTSYMLVYYLLGTNPASGKDIITGGIVIVAFLVFLAGLILFLWNEYLGTILSLAGYILVFIPELIIQRGGSLTIVFLVLSLPSVFYLVYWKLNKDELGKPEDVKPE